MAPSSTSRPSYPSYLERRRERYANDPSVRDRVRQENRRRYKANPLAAYASRFRRLYKMTYDDFLAMAEAQGGLCAICGEQPSSGQTKRCRGLYIDHDHATGKVRGLLCTNCNNGIGHFKDSIARLLKAIDYLKRHEPKESAA